MPEGRGMMLGDGAFDAKPALNAIVSRGYGARIRDGATMKAYTRIGASEGMFGALTVEFGDRLKTRRKESTKTRTLLRIIIYCLRIIVRWLMSSWTRPVRAGDTVKLRLD
jgi:hypothetical protein